MQTALTGLAGIVAASLTLDELLTTVAEFAAHAIPGAVAAGVTLAQRPEARIRVWAATTDFVGAVDTIQYEVYDEGPSIRTHPDPMRWGEPAVLMGAEFAGPVAVSIHNARTLLEAQHGADLLQRKLAYRSPINQAIGIIRDRSGPAPSRPWATWSVSAIANEHQLNVAAERLVEESVGCAPAS